MILIKKSKMIINLVDKVDKIDDEFERKEQHI